MSKFLILGAIGVIAVICVTAFALSKTKKDDGQTHDMPKKANKNENTDITEKVEKITEVKDEVLSTMTERHNIAVELIKQTVDEINSDTVPESQNDADFDNMLNDLDMLSDKE